MNNKSHAQFTVSQGAVIENAKGQILILKLHYSNWGIPGGHLHENEDWLDGLKREVNEETGITNFDVKSVGGISVKGSGYGVWFHATTSEIENVVLSDEHDAYAWVSSKEELDTYDFCHPAIKNCVLKVIEQL